MKTLAEDAIQQWIDALLAVAPEPTPEQAALLRRVFQNVSDASSPASDAA